MQLRINGTLLDVGDGENRTLLWVLRDLLGLTGTKFGCGVGLCGACTIHVNGKATRACITTVAQVKDREIRTIEGLGVNGEFHPVQEAFLLEQTPQCGWCMVGQMMTAASFLEENPDPTEEDIDQALRRNFCRCGAYTRIRKAVHRAAELKRLEGEG